MRREQEATTRSKNSAQLDESGVPVLPELDVVDADHDVDGGVGERGVVRGAGRDPDLALLDRSGCGRGP
jgi:hypothetical protein